MEFLRAKGALKYTSVVAAPADAPISKRYAALCSACSQGEHIRDGGGHALVVLDDISCMASCSAFWKSPHCTTLTACSRCDPLNPWQAVAKLASPANA